MICVYTLTRTRSTELCKPISLVKQKHSRTYLLPRSSMQSTLVSCCQSIYFLLSSVLVTPGYPSESIVDTIISYCSKRRLAVSVVCIFDSLDHVDKFTEIHIFRPGYFTYYYSYFKVVR